MNDITHSWWVVSFSQHAACNFVVCSLQPCTFPGTFAKVRAGTISTTTARGVLEPPPGLQTRSWAIKWLERWW